jgi:polyribonucleotide nucleotidyltransferase
MDFGAFVTILPGKDGLVHISQISDERVEKVSDKLSEGDLVRAKSLIDNRQKNALSANEMVLASNKPIIHLRTAKSVLTGASSC